ncbi:DNA adenine methylase [Wielerella bovis]|uniref:DNA adenine methylase n=1 Tax=Wielerella bovis TaxID=2917790 RepID=UPI002018A35D|nr:DNA adenine methylase [Wielerella bovis]MCG7655952.1 DNA adenine methylase [Wielerella bovis]MCG7655975.1 DNA adenine methylase [Wielerella bovis]MCG7656859.1 DNA adenine methylase [Wielerella bovis]MCG7658131.1 DNA adenine methylase [Wielerella bovis]MCG7658201.1 DNA adenine methylase [Wielerella bovis]
MPDKRPASPLRGWFGGKYRLTSTLIPLIPPHRCYAEVFGGAAWLLFHKPNEISKLEVINDINSDIINLYRVVQNHLPELLRLAETMLPSREEFERLQALEPRHLTDIQRAVRFLYLHRLCFGGRVGNPIFSAQTVKRPRFNAKKLTEQLESGRERLQQVLLENLNYQEFIQRYDKPDTFFYIDPPYWDREYEYGIGLFGKADFEKLATQLRQIKGKFLLSINDKPQIRQIFAGFEMQTVQLRYSVHDSNKQGTELLIANYPIILPQN